LGMYKSELHASESSEVNYNNTINVSLSLTMSNSPQFLCLINNWQPRVHGLHAQNLVIALLVIEHGSSKVVKDILSCQRSVGLVNNGVNANTRVENVKGKKPGSIRAI